MCARPGRSCRRFCGGSRRALKVKHLTRSHGRCARRLLDAKGCVREGAQDWGVRRSSGAGGRHLPSSSTIHRQLSPGALACIDLLACTREWLCAIMLCVWRAEQAACHAKDLSWHMVILLARMTRSVGLSHARAVTRCGPLLRLARGSLVSGSCSISCESVSLCGCGGGLRCRGTCARWSGRRRRRVRRGSRGEV